MDFIGEQLTELQTLMVKLDNPNNSAHDFKEIAFEASLRATELLNLERWLWSDLKEIPATTNEFGNHVPERVELLPDRFVSAFAMPAYSLALAVFILAAVRHVKEVNPTTAEAKRQFVASSYGAALDTHITATSLRYRWEDENSPSLEPGQSLQERVRERISCSIIPQNKYARNGKCSFDIYSNDTVAGKRKLRRTFDITDLGPDEHNVLCTYPEHIAWADEMEAEEESFDVQLLQLWSDTLTHFQSTGRMPPGTQFVGQFPSWTAARADIYLIGQDGTLTAIRQIWPRTISDYDEEVVVGFGWAGGKAVPGGGSIIYFGYPDGSWFWYRHLGAEQPRLTDNWRPRQQVIAAPHGKPWFRNRRIFGGGDGILYGIVQNSEILALPSGEIVPGPKRGALMWMRHADYLNGTGGFNAETKVGEGWHEVRQAFSMGEGIVYAIMNDGILRWNKHKGYLTGEYDWEGWNEVGSGWHMVRDVFPAGEGLIYAREANGRTFCYRDKAWRNGGGDFDRRVELIDVIPDHLGIFAALPGADFFRGPA